MLPSRWLRPPCRNIEVKTVASAWALPVPCRNAVKAAGVNAQRSTNGSPKMTSRTKTSTLSPMSVSVATAGRETGCSLATGMTDTVAPPRRPSAVGGPRGPGS
jgi:hypothetical protein